MAALSENFFAVFSCLHEGTGIAVGCPTFRGSMKNGKWGNSAAVIVIPLAIVIDPWIVDSDPCGNSGVRN